ncbi:MAG: glycosyltransferase family 4 protein [Cyanothece sp. SIO1E1]|nr:glycosyltransferase family 4 protein [Cyanothece sp. SIO1E1]
MTSWITCQLGAREHYAIPRALHQTGQLHTLITDAWVTPQSPLHYLPDRVAKSLGDRYHPDLSTAHIKAFTRSLIPFELGQRLSRTSGWSNILLRNQWFQHRALRTLKVLANQLTAQERPILFSYSYTALKLFRYAKQQGWYTILGQIDPGVTEEKQVASLQATYGHRYQSTWAPAPEVYWQTWQQECQLADHILVNSPWSQTALTNVGIPNDKITIAPLAYQPPIEAKTFTRQYPFAFTHKRPLRVLFLGQIILRKGIAALLEAIAYLDHEPIEIWLVGSTQLTIPPVLCDHPQLKWLGPLPRSQVQHYYQQADVFLFPTHSDGFGLTQLEAQAWQLPIIASQNCGEVITHQQNGLILSVVSGHAIADSLMYCLQHPERLQQFAEYSVDMNAYSLQQLHQNLQNLVHVSI